jgi:hypothetical protein
MVIVRGESGLVHVADRQTELAETVRRKQARDVNAPCPPDWHARA